MTGIGNVLPVGITPAYAGKSYCYADNHDRFGDHPRLCGEKSIEKFQEPIDKGSPPPMRGKGQCTLFVNFSIRITPAYAGKRHEIPISSRF